MSAEVGSSKGPVGLGAVGLGRWARVMARAYSPSPSVELTSCFSRNPERRNRFAADFGCAPAESLDELLADPGVEGVVVTVPNDQHADVIEAAARAGKHVYVEKPVAVNPGDLTRISRALASYPVIFAVGHSARRLAGLREMRRSIDSGEAGTGLMAEAVFANERGLDLKEGDWRADPAAAPGGPLTQLGIHQIDNLQYLLGPALRVLGMGRYARAEIRNHLAVAALLEFESGLGYLGTNWMTPGSFTIDLYGSRARYRYELDFSWWSDSDLSDEHSSLSRVAIAQDSPDPDARMLARTEVTLRAGNHLRQEIDEFAAAIRGTARVEVDFAEAARNVAVMLAIARSVQTGASVEVSPLLAEVLNA